jgi:PatG C-terminal
MQQLEIAEQPGPPSPPGPLDGAPSRASDPHTAPARETAEGSFVFALGRVEPRFPSLAVEKEFAQVTGRAQTAGQTDRQTLHSVLADRANRYLARQMCWVFTIEGLETYVLGPRDPVDFELLIEAVRSGPQPTDVDVVIGRRGPLAPPEVCGGLVVPVVAFDNLYSFDRDELIGAIPRPDEVPEDQDDQFRATATELLDRIMQMADNAGATDEHRALNYLAVRYPAVYARTAEAHRTESSLTGVEVRPSRLSGTRRIVDVIFSYTHRRTDVTEKYFVRVDVTEEFPFLVTKLSPYYQRT